jgi:hypothetical protein
MWKKVKNPEFSFDPSREKQAEYFSKDKNAANHPELLKLVHFSPPIPAHNEKVCFLPNAESVDIRVK